MTADKKAADPTAVAHEAPARATATATEAAADPARSSDPVIKTLLDRIGALEDHVLVLREAVKKADAFGELVRSSITELHNGVATLAKQSDHISVFLESMPAQEGTTDVYRRHMMADQSAVRELMGGG